MIQDDYYGFFGGIVEKIFLNEWKIKTIRQQIAFECIEKCDITTNRLIHNGLNEVCALFLNVNERHNSENIQNS